MTPRRPSSSAIAVLTLFGIAMTGCGAGDPASVSAEAEEEIFVQTPHLWPSARHSDRTRIGVCFVNEPGRTVEREWVRDAVRRTWSSAAKIDFEGFGTCRARTGGDVTIIGGIPENVRINIVDDRPKVEGGLGTDMDSMRLNFTFQSFRPDCSVDEATREFCVRAYAIHEFGHALGLAHEHNRSDRDSNCTAEHNGNYGDTFWEYDANSVMNYCAGDRTLLSVLDREGIKILYGGKGTFGDNYYSLWNHGTKRFLYMDTKPRSTDIGIFSSDAISQTHRLQVLRPNVSPANGRLGYGNRIVLKSALVVNNQPFYVGPGGATRTPYEWTIEHTDGSTTVTAVDIRMPFTLTGTNSQGRKVFLNSSGGATTTHNENSEWRFIGGTRTAPRDD